MFIIAHDDRYYTRFIRLYYILTRAVFIINIYIRLYNYIKYYGVYKLNATPRYKPFGTLKPIITPPILGFIVLINFIVSLLITPRINNSILTIIDKFSKKVNLVPGSLELTVS